MTVDEDEGLAQLEGILAYLAPLARLDEADQLSGDFEAYCVVESCQEAVLEAYKCRFCGYPIGDKTDRYCSKSCYIADMEGM
jgi:hypothetical protein